MPGGHGREEYTMQRMLERRNRNNIRRVLERNGRRLTAREIDIVNLCTRYPEQRYTLFTYYCDANCMQLNPYVLPYLPVPDHHQHHHHNQHHQQAARSLSNTYSYASTSTVAPLLFQLNVDANPTSTHADRQAESSRPSSSRATLPCYLLADKPHETPNSSSIEFNPTTVNVIADTINGSIKSSSNKGSSNEDNDEKRNPDSTNSKKGSRKNSKKKKKKNRKKGGANAGPSSRVQTEICKNLSKDPCDSSDSSSISSAEISLLDGDTGDQRLNRDTEILHLSFSSNSSGLCHGGDVSYSKSMHCSAEGEETELALPEILEPEKDVANEDQSTLKEINKANMDPIQSSDVCIGNESVPVFPGRRGRHGRNFTQQSRKPSRIATFRGNSSNQFSTRQEKPSKIASRDKFSYTERCKQRDSINETLRKQNSWKKTDPLYPSDTKLDVKPSSTKLPICSRRDNDRSKKVLEHEYIFKKDDFPSLPSARSDKKEIVMHKAGPRLTLREKSKKSPILLPLKISEENKDLGCEDAIGNKLNIPILKMRIGEVAESSIGSSSSSAGFLSPDSSKSSHVPNRFSHDTSGPDSPRTSSDETQLKAEFCPSASDEGHNEIQPSGDNSPANGKSAIEVAESGCDTYPADLANNAPDDINASSFGSSMCSYPTTTTTTPILPSTDVMPYLDNIGEMKNVSAVCCSDVEEIVGAVWTANRVHQIAELVQATFGGPLADYELLCHYAAPTVELPPHQIANVPLRKIWQWYEEPSCYALEVKGCLDHQCLEQFNAHFVPSLSAVQLFVRHGPSADISMHLPKQSKSKYSLSVEDMFRVGDAELVFEFFEYEQPYFRKTLFEKVKELIARVSQGRSHVHGNAHNLEKLLLAHLHPASWYSVAWYPAYRVPGGRSSFKAAFLTYHSLAQNVQGIAGPSTGNRIAVSSFPAVGMVSYNTQEESWFHERCQNGGDVMEQRLESLSHTAGVMSRARVMRGDQLAENHHPDFEFFESRRYHD